MISILAPLSAAIMSAVAPHMVTALDLEGPSSAVIQQSDGGGFIIVSRTPKGTTLRESTIPVGAGLFLDGVPGIAAAPRALGGRP